MPLSIAAVNTEQVPLSLDLFDEEGGRVTGRYPSALVYSRNGTTLIASVDLTEVTPGNYTGLWAVTAVDKFLVRYAVYTDSDRNDLEAGYIFDQPDMVIADQAAAQPPPLVGSGVNPALTCS